MDLKVNLSVPLRRLEMLENSKAEKLNEDVENWIKAINIRNYTTALRENAENLSGLDEWTEWCLIVSLM